MFEELQAQFLRPGWDVPPSRTPVRFEFDTQTYELIPLARVGGFFVFYCDALPEPADRKRLQLEISCIACENLCVYQGKIWQSALKVPGKPVQFQEIAHGPQVAELLRRIEFTLEDHQTGVSTLDAAHKVRAAFVKNTEKVTKSFYERFKKEHSLLARAVLGTQDSALKERYAGVLLNRLMFVYFIQKKGMLFGPDAKPDPDYLRNRLHLPRYFRDFLLPLFFQRLGAPHDPIPHPIFGRVPYLNGGIFQQHEIESLYPNLDLPNPALERIYDFFDLYRWHLDDRPSKDPRQINPDVIGYIFKKYINDRAAMGAYYTQEDVTLYIAKNSIIPAIFHKAQFDPLPDLFRQILRANPLRYLYPALIHGINPIEDGLPDDVKAGLDPNPKHLYRIRAPWNRPAAPAYALPTEIRRETIARRQRYLHTLDQIRSDNIAAIEDLVTLNLDIQQFAQDLIAWDPSIDHLRKFYRAVRSLTVLDPTCGSGAFLFAALAVLEPLYQTCLDAMKQFVQDFQQRPPVPGLDPIADFKQTLADVNAHPNPQYFVYKSIILNNLYGVDLMPEAVEVAKLRLFLKLASAADLQPQLPNPGIEPLPDIDFNIRTGNTLIGFARLSDIRHTLRHHPQACLDFGLHSEKLLRAIEDDAQACARQFQHFQNLQHPPPSPDIAQQLQTAKTQLQKLNLQLDRLLAHSYNVEVSDDPQALRQWKLSHQPFHWCVQFYEIVQQNGGFDVVVGNPPYVEYNEVKYKIKDYLTLQCGNLYAFVLERVSQIVNSSSRIGQIVPVSIISTPGYKSLRQLYLNLGRNYISSYNIHPSCLFEGAYPRLAIVLTHPGTSKELYTTGYHKWLSEEREYLFQQLCYTKVNSDWLPELVNRALPKVGNNLSMQILSKLRSKKHRIGEYLMDTKKSTAKSFYYRRAFGAFILFYDFIPEMFDEEGAKMLPSELKEIKFQKRYEPIILAIYHSNLFYFYTYVFSDCRNINKSEMEGLNICLEEISESDFHELSERSHELHEDLLKNSQMMVYNYKTGKRTFQAFYPRLSKPIMDEIDRVLSGHYGLTEEELDYIVHYDAKYRMGRDHGDGGVE